MLFQNNNFKHKILINCLKLGKHPKFTNKKLTQYIYGTRNNLDLFELLELQHVFWRLCPLIHSLFKNYQVNSWLDVNAFQSKKSKFLSKTAKDTFFKDRDENQNRTRNKNDKNPQNKFPRLPKNSKVYDKFFFKVAPIQILFATNTLLYKEIIQQAASLAQMPFHAGRWLPGAINARITAVSDIQAWRPLSNSNIKNFYNYFAKKHKKSALYRQPIKNVWTGQKQPSLIILPDINKNDMIVQESAKLSIPILGLTNSDEVNLVDYPFLGNSDSSFLVNFFCQFVASLIAKQITHVRQNSFEYKINYAQANILVKSLEKEKTESLPKTSTKKKYNHFLLRNTSYSLKKLTFKKVKIPMATPKKRRKKKFQKLKHFRHRKPLKIFIKFKVFTDRKKDSIRQFVSQLGNTYLFKYKQKNTLQIKAELKSHFQNFQKQALGQISEKAWAKHLGQEKKKKIQKPKRTLNYHLDPRIRAVTKIRNLSLKLKMQILQRQKKKLGGPNARSLFLAKAKVFPKKPKPKVLKKHFKTLFWKKPKKMPFAGNYLESNEKNLRKSFLALNDYKEIRQKLLKKLIQLFTALDLSQKKKLYVTYKNIYLMLLNDLIPRSQKKALTTSGIVKTSFFAANNFYNLHLDTPNFFLLNLKNQFKHNFYYQILEQRLKKFVSKKKRQRALFPEYNPYYWTRLKMLFSQDYIIAGLTWFDWFSERRSHIREGKQWYYLRNKYKYHKKSAWRKRKQKKNLKNQHLSKKTVKTYKKKKEYLKKV